MLKYPFSNLVTILLFLNFNISIAGIKTCSSYYEAKSQETNVDVLELAAIAKERGFSNKFVENMMQERPDILKLIAGDEAVYPVKAYRGLTVDLSDYDPTFIPKHPQSWAPQRFQDEYSNPYVSTNLSIALNYAKKKNNPDGMVIEFEVPSFMVTEMQGERIASKGFIKGQITRSFLGKDESPFIKKITALTKGPLNTSSLDKKKFPPKLIKSLVQGWEDYEK